MKKSCHGLVLSGDRTRVYVKKHAFTHASFKNNDEFIAVFQNVPMRGARGKVGVWRVRNKTSPHDWVNEFYFFQVKKPCLHGANDTWELRYLDVADKSRFRVI